VRPACAWPWLTIELPVGIWGTPAPAELVASTTAVPAGAILAMLADMMIPEAFKEHRLLTGLIAAAGFLAAFTVDQVVG
jgi:zinc transporter, ZIP family